MEFVSLISSIFPAKGDNESDTFATFLFFFMALLAKRCSVSRFVSQDSGKKRTFTDRLSIQSAIFFPFLSVYLLANSIICVLLYEELLDWVPNHASDGQPEIFLQGTQDYQVIHFLLTESWCQNQCIATLDIMSEKNHLLGPYKMVPKRVV